MTIQEKVRIYLNESESAYEVGQFEYYARIALDEALKAFEEKNYGIGAVALQVTHDTIKEYRARNAMVSGLGVVDHAETRALLDLKENKQPHAVYKKDTNEWTKKLPIGISVFGTLEPCPMCTCTLTNVGAKLSISTARDGNLITTADGYKISDGAANVVAYEEEVDGKKIEHNKFKIQPRVWQEIQTKQKISFSILSTPDKDLTKLSLDIFLETREEIDSILSERGTLVSATIN